MSFEARAYQTTAVASVIAGYEAGARQLLLRLPTGAGKTVIAALLIEQLLKGLGSRRILFLAHRREIIDQTAEKIGRLLGADRVSIEQAERKATAAARVVVASIQTLAGRLDAFPAGDYGALIVDECHHAYAKSWMETIAHFGSNADTLLLGLTATPKRSDGRCVSELFRETAFEISLAELQEQGYLVPMDYFTVEASLGLGALAMDASGDFQAHLLGKIMNSAEIRALTLRAWMERAKDQKTIAFCASVEHAEDLAIEFEQAGVRSAFIAGDTADRNAIIDAFRAGELTFLSNYNVLTEGFDDPSIACVLLARPTTSPLVYSQCLGRGLRSYPGKRACTVIDIVDRQRQQLQYNAFEAAGLKRSWRGSGKDPLREAAAIARIRVTDPSAFLQIRNALSLSETQAILMSLDPRTVLAGIDGMPLLRYQALPVEASLEQKRPLAEDILRAAGLDPVNLEFGPLQAAATIATAESLPPYLSWHLEQATGLRWDLQAVAPAALLLEDESVQGAAAADAGWIASDANCAAADPDRAAADAGQAAPEANRAAAIRALLAVDHVEPHQTPAPIASDTAQASLPPSTPRPAAAPGLGLKARMDQIIHAAKHQTPPSSPRLGAEPRQSTPVPPTAMSSGREGAASGKSSSVASPEAKPASKAAKGFSIQDRLQAIKAELSSKET